MAEVTHSSCFNSHCMITLQVSGPNISTKTLTEIDEAVLITVQIQLKRS